MKTKKVSGPPKHDWEKCDQIPTPTPAERSVTSHLVSLCVRPSLVSLCVRPILTIYPPLSRPCAPSSSLPQAGNRSEAETKSEGKYLETRSKAGFKLFKEKDHEGKSGLCCYDQTPHCEHNCCKQCRDKPRAQWSIGCKYLIGRLSRVRI